MVCAGGMLAVLIDSNTETNLQQAGNAANCHPFRTGDCKLNSPTVQNNASRCVEHPVTLLPVRCNAIPGGVVGGH